LVVQRTKLVDQSQEILLNLLGELTSGLLVFNLWTKLFVGHFFNSF
jgi:hypothetical protein